MPLTKSTPFLARLQVDPRFNPDGSLAACEVQAFFAQNLIDDSTTPPTLTPLGFSPSGPTTIDCVKDAAKTVTFNGATYTYAEIAKAMALAAEQERVAQSAPAS